MTVSNLKKTGIIFNKWTTLQNVCKSFLLNNDGYLYPLRSKNDYRPGLYRTGCMDLYVPPQGNERPMYSQQNIIMRGENNFFYYSTIIMYINLNLFRIISPILL